MLRVERIESWRGQDVLDSAGEKAGRLEEVYYDADGQEPVLISIKHGRLGHHVSLVPVSEMVVSRDYIRLPFPADEISRSPNVSVEDEVSPEAAAAVCTLFKVTATSSGPLYASSALEQRRADASQARQRADDAQLEAQHRQEEADEATKKATAAAAEADAARRAHEQAEAAAPDSASGGQAPA
jgi:PRC-barrel domain